MDIGYINYKLEKLLKNMTQKERLEILTGEKMPEPTEPLQYRKLLPNTPIWIIGEHENGYNLILGKWKLTKEPICKGILDYDLLENMCHKHLDTFKWDYITSMIIAISTDILTPKATN